MTHRAKILRATLAVVALAILGASALGSQEEPQKAVGPYSGTVVDPAGKPAAGVKVWVVIDDGPRDASVRAETTTDDKGQFHIGQVPWEFFPRFLWPRLIARDSQGRIGATRGSIDTAATEYRFPLQDVKDYQGRLLDPSGQPIAKAKIIPARLTCDCNPGLVKRYDSCAIPNPLRNVLAAQTRADGSFTLHGLPAYGHLEAVVATEGFGTCWGRWDLAEPVTIRMGRTANIHGSIRCEKDPQAVTRVKVSFSTPGQYEQSPVPGGACRLYYQADAVIHKDGTFQVDKFPAGPCSLGLEVPDDFPYFGEEPQLAELKPGETTTVSITFNPALKVQGKVVDRETKKGIPGVRLSLYIQDEAGRQGMQRAATTDAQGVFTVHVRAGRASLNIEDGLVPQYVYRAPRRQNQEIEITGDMTLPPIELEREKTLEGIVVDPSGKPVANAEIRYTDFENYRTLSDVVHSDASGKFSLRKLSSGTTTMVRARTDKAAADPLFFVPAEIKHPIRLVVSEKLACSVRGLVVDDAGKPIKGAEVNLTTVWRSGGGGIGLELAKLKSDDQGRFELGGLWPGDGYQIQVSAEGHDKSSAGETAGEAGQAADFGKIVLARLGGAVEGTVVDSSGKPMAGVRVFNSGDGLEPIHTTTDAGGRFRLAGLRAGTVYVFANKDDFRFTGVRTTSGATGVSIKVFRKDEPLPPQPPRSAPMSDQQRQKLIQELAEKYQAKGDRATAERFKAMSRMGRAYAQDWSALAETDLDEALSLIGQHGPGAFYALKQLAEHFVASDPEKAMRCAEEMIVRARSLDQPERAAAIAQTGVLVNRLGNKEAGRKLIEEAADMLAKMGGSESAKRVRAQVAGAVATFDLDRALKLVKDFGDSNQTDYVRYQVAASLDDPEKAEAVLKGINPWYAQRARIRIAYRLAAKDPAAAIRWIENMPRSPYGEGEQNKALAYGWLAAVIAPKDKTLACSLIDRALAIYMTPSDQRRWGPRGGAPVQAAMLAVQAQQIGYPDMQSVIWRVLSLRPTTRDAYNPAGVVESNVAMAALLALADPDTAKQLLQSVEPRSEELGSGYSGVGRDMWFMAWALADPKHAMELIEQAMSLSASKDRTKQQILQGGLGSVIQMWSLPPPERLKFLAGRLGIEQPDQEY